MPTDQSGRESIDLGTLRSEGIEKERNNGRLLTAGGVGYSGQSSTQRVLVLIPHRIGPVEGVGS